MPLIATRKIPFSSIKMTVKHHFHFKQSYNLDTHMHTRTWDTKAAKTVIDQRTRARNTSLLLSKKNKSCKGSENCFNSKPCCRYDRGVWITEGFSYRGDLSQKWTTTTGAGG